MRPPPRPILASWVPRLSAAPPRPAVPSWIAPRALPAPVSRLPLAYPPTGTLRPQTGPSRPAAGLSVGPGQISGESAPPEDDVHAVVVVARPSPVPNDVIALESVALREENAALHVELAALREENAALILQLDASAQALGSLREVVLKSSEPELVALAVSIARRVIGRELTTDPALVAAWAREALDALSARDGLTVTVSPDVAEKVSPDAWNRALSAPHTVAVDASLPPVSCSLRAGASAADASLDGRLAAVREVLSEEGS